MSEKLNLLKYALKNALIGMLRHWALCLSSIVTVFLVMMLVAVFVILGMHVDAFSANTAQSMSVHVILQQDLPEEDIEQLQREIEKNPNVASVVFSSKDEELELMIKEKGESFAIYRGEENPLSHAFFVYLTDESQIAKTAQELENLQGILDTAYGGSSTGQLIRVLSLLRLTSAALIVLLFLLALYLIYNTIRTTIYSRQSEIAIMWSVGATDSFIRIPFEIEGILIGLCGALVPFLLVSFGYPMIYHVLGGRFFIGAFVLYKPAYVQTVMAWSLLGFGALSGWLASFLSANQYIRKTYSRPAPSKAASPRSV